MANQEDGFQCSSSSTPEEDALYHTVPLGTQSSPNELFYGTQPSLLTGPRLSSNFSSSYEDISSKCDANARICPLSNLAGTKRNLDVVDEQEGIDNEENDSARSSDECLEPSPPSKLLNSGKLATTSHKELSLRDNSDDERLSDKDSEKRCAYIYSDRFVVDSSHPFVASDKSARPIFATAGMGKEIAVSESSLRRAEEILAGDEGAGSKDVIVGAKQLDGGGCYGMSFDSRSYTVDEALPVFKTAGSGKKISVSDEALTRASKLMETCMKETGSDSLSTSCREARGSETLSPMTPTASPGICTANAQVTKRLFDDAIENDTLTSGGLKHKRNDLGLYAEAEKASASESLSRVSRNSYLAKGVALVSISTVSGSHESAMPENHRTRSTVLFEKSNSSEDILDESSIDCRIPRIIPKPSEAREVVRYASALKDRDMSDSSRPKRVDTAKLSREKQRNLCQPANEGKDSSTSAKFLAEGGYSRVETKTACSGVGGTVANYDAPNPASKLSPTQFTEANGQASPMGKDRPIAAAITGSKNSLNSLVRNPYARKPVSAAAELDAKASPTFETNLPPNESTTAVVLPSTHAPSPNLTVQSVRAISQPSGNQASHTSVGRSNNMSDLRLPQSLTAQSSIAYHERLPSRTISFTSAEVLTVSELYQHIHFYNDRSVRVTGVLLLHDVSGKFVLLGDPLAESRPTNGFCRDAVFAKNPYQHNRGMSISKTPVKASITVTNVDTSAAKRNSLLGSTGRKRKLVSNGGAGLKSFASGIKARRNVGGLLDFTKEASTINGSNMARQNRVPLSFAAAAEVIRRQRRNGVAVVAVDVTCTTPMLFELNEDYNATTAVGDLVMVIGEVRRVPSAGSDGAVGVCEEAEQEGIKVTEGLRHASLLLANRVQTIVNETEKCAVHAEGSTGKKKLTEEADSSTPVKDDSDGRSLFLASRIARNANGTDLRLQSEALLLRRKHMQERMGDIFGASAGYVVGCGPPAKGDS